jgi:electron transport complex protein RnfC
MKTFRIGGVHPAENKLSAAEPIKVAELPKVAVFPMGQHIGAPAVPVVQKGDKV